MYLNLKRAIIGNTITGSTVPKITRDDIILTHLSPRHLSKQKRSI
jgi:hypothetical protein